MLNIAKRFFNKITPAGTETSGQTNTHDVRVATCALLLEMARIDDAFTDEETSALVRILRETYGLSQVHADALIQEADKELEKSVDYWQFAKLINQNYGTTEKVAIIETLWQIVFVDGKMDKYENYLMHKLANLLRLSHQQLIDAKLRVLYPQD